MEHLYTMVRISDIDASLDSMAASSVAGGPTQRERARYTLIFLAAPGDIERARSDAGSPMLELSYNWPRDLYGRPQFRQLAYRVDGIHATCQRRMDGGVTINRPPRDGRMAFVRSRDGISIEILQKGDTLPTREPRASMPNTGSW
ncbi:MAG TPA: VOC family protein [Geminicoccaceae bacterium]|nr:VOC family protein [Geminicoccaceae bacterium]